MREFFVIHCHFYQPPRFDPFTLEFSKEPLAYPFKNWNEKIAFECYSKLVDELRYLSNDWGPTLLYWMKREERDLFKRLVEVLKESKTAIAHPYYHVILPLARKNDRLVLLEWGRRIFERFFGYEPFGVWLPETAVDVETLHDVKRTGFKFVVLGQDQVKPENPGFFRISQVEDLFVFAFNRALSGLLSFSPEDFYNAENLEKAFSSGGRVAFAALDGETFGHHKKGADKGLKNFIARNKDRMVSLNEIFSRNVPRFCVEVKENTSWSCPHGFLRWMDHCGCNTGGHPNWNQRWRRPLREALNWLNARIDELFHKEGETLFTDSFETLLDYIYFFDEPSEENLRIVKKHFIDDTNLTRGLLLLEMKNCALSMFTSCGWFFDDISGHETIIILKFAKRAMDIAYREFGVWLEDGFLNILSKAESNLKSMGNGRDIYWRFVKSSVRTWKETLIEFIKREAFIPDVLSLGRFLFRFCDVRTSRCEDFELKTAWVRVKDMLTEHIVGAQVVILDSGKSKFVYVGDLSFQEIEELHENFSCDILSFFVKFSIKLHFNR